MTIGELARLGGVNIETIRYYEKIGLLPVPPRSDGGHRRYADQHLNRLVFIRRSRQLGFSLDTVRGLLDHVQNGHSCAEIRETASVHLDDIRRKIADLQRMEQTLSATVAECERGNAPHCPIIEILSHDHGEPRC